MSSCRDLLAVLLELYRERYNILVGLILDSVSMRLWAIFLGGLKWEQIFLSVQNLDFWRQRCILARSERANTLK